MSLRLASIINGSCVVCVSMSLGFTFVLYGSLCYLSFYVIWSHFVLYESMLSEFICHLVSLPLCTGFLCCLSFYVTWSHFRSVCVSMLSEFLCHLVSLPLYIVHHVVRVSMSLGLTSVLYVSLCCQSFYVI